MIQSQEELSALAAEKVVEQVLKKPDCSLGLPTGRTPRLMYRELVRLTGQKGVNWSSVQCFALDEYLGVEKEVDTFQAYLEENLYRHVHLPKANKHNPASVDDYDSEIKKRGGLDLTILGIGGNGHIAFNEPGTPRLSFTQCIWLDESSRKTLAANFGSLESTPQKAVTMGISTILASRSIIMLAFGQDKKAIVERAFANGINPEIPASYLKVHEDVSILTDWVQE